MEKTNIILNLKHSIWKGVIDLIKIKAACVRAACCLKEMVCEK
jgi:hypothetical protein